MEKFKTESEYNLFIDKSIKYYIEKIYNATGVKIDRLSKVYYKNDNGYVYNNQILGSLVNIHYMILAKKKEAFRITSVVAETQTGKTGVMANTIFLLESYDAIREFLGLELGKSLVITAMSDRANIDQLRNDILAMTGARKDKRSLLSQDGVLHNPNLMSELNKDDFKVIENGIIFNDESHLAANTKSVNYKFYWENELSINGNSDLSLNNIYLNNISATPYDEVVANSAKETRNINKLVPGFHYKSIRDLNTRQGFPLKSQKNYNRLKKILLKINKKGYYIIRVSSNTETHKCVPKGFDSVNYFQDDKYDLSKFLKNKPSRPTIVFIKNKMMQSYQLEKSNIVMSFDRVGNESKEERTMFIAQGLAGRLTGYVDHDIILYTDLDNIQYHIDYLDNKIIPSTKYTRRITIREDSKTNLLKISFDNDISNLSNKEIVKLLLKRKELEFLKDYQHNSNFRYDLNNSTYDYYITGAYKDIEKFGGISSRFFIRNKDKYKDGDKVYAVFIDIVNNNVIIAHRVYNISDDIHYFNEFRKGDKNICSFSDKHTEPETISSTNIAQKKLIGVAKSPMDGSEVKVFYDIKKKSLVIRKNSKTMFEEVNQYIKNFITIKNIEFPCKSNNDKIEQLEAISKITGVKKSDFKTGRIKFEDIILD